MNSSQLSSHRAGVEDLSIYSQPGDDVQLLCATNRLVASGKFHSY